MKAITLTQPWATLVALGSKRIDTRSWSTRYRGELAIHAACHFPSQARGLALSEPFVSALQGMEPQELPRGAIVAICTLVNCIQITDKQIPPEPERSFGVYLPGRWAWYLEDIRRLEPSIPAKGRLGLWEWSIPGDTLIAGREQNHANT